MSTLTEPNIPNAPSSYKNQFNLVKGGDKTASFMDNKYSFLNEPTTYGREEVSVNTMHPFNYMDRFKNNPKMEHMSNRRDNTLIINNYHSNEVGQYSKKKEEAPALFEPVVNLNAMAGDTKIVDKISLDRFSSTLQYKSNEYPENTYVRAEQIDGTPLTEVVRPREKTLEELRGQGVNSVRLAPEGRNNQTAGTVAGGVSTDPKSITITTFKMKSYRDQNSVDDLLRTTGQITRPEWRSMVKQSESERSFMPSIDGPPVSAVMKQEYHSEQSARPTNRTDYEDNIHISNAVNTVGGLPVMRNEQSAKPTNRTEYEENIHITNAVSTVGGKEEFRNGQTARPTYRNDYENNIHILNGASFIPSAEYRNEQALKPTNRTDYENNTNILNGASFIPSAEYRNDQALKPTYRTDYENNTHILNGASFVPSTEYRNNQSANPTYRTDYEHNNHILNATSYVSNSEYRNNQSANPTYRTDYEHNYITAAGYNSTAGYVYENNQSARPTYRTDYENSNYSGHGSNSNVGYVYENYQPANPTLRATDNEFIGVGFNQTNSQYKKYGDITRSGVVEEVLAKDYMGTETSFVPRQEDRTFAVNMINNQTIEDSINLTKRDLMGGGADRIPQGRENIGEYKDWGRREKNAPVTNRVRNVAVNYIQEVPETRGYNLLQERSNINQYVPEILNNNPFVNNVVHTTNTIRDIIRENTFISDREINRS